MAIPAAAGFWSSLAGSAATTTLPSISGAVSAVRNRKWQQRMSSTAHQREVADLRAAGLNPILSATGGAGASTPGGSTGSVEMSDPVTTAYQKSLQRREQDRQDNLAKSQIDLNLDQAMTLATQRAVNSSMASLNMAKKLESFSSSNLMSGQRGLLKYQANKLVSEALLNANLMNLNNAQKSALMLKMPALEKSAELSSLPVVGEILEILDHLNVNFGLLGSLPKLPGIGKKSSTPAPGAGRFLK